MYFTEVKTKVKEIKIEQKVEALCISLLGLQ